MAGVEGTDNDDDDDLTGVEGGTAVRDGAGEDGVAVVFVVLRSSSFRGVTAIGATTRRPMNARAAARTARLRAAYHGKGSLLSVVVDDDDVGGHGDGGSKRLAGGATAVNDNNA